MKMLYTLEEIQNIGKDELLSLMSVVGTSNVIFYSEIALFQKTKNNGKNHYSIVTSNGEEFSFASKEDYENALLGKSRYNLLMKSLEQVTAQNDIESRINDSLNKRLNAIENKLDQNHKKSLELASEIRDKLTLKVDAALGDIRNNADASFNLVDKKITSSIEKIQNIDSDAYKKTIEKMEKISNSFSELLR